MAKDKENKKVEGKSGNRLLYYDELHFIPVESKNKRWAAEVIYFCKNNSKPMFDPASLQRRRESELGEINEKAFKKLIDPEDGTAEYFTADWKANPIFVHLNNIVDAKIERISTKLEVKAIDEFSKQNLQKENERILGKREYMSYINSMNAKLGFPQLKENEDPYRYAQAMQAKATGGKGNMASAATMQMPTNMVDSLKAGIEDNEGLALFNEYIWKDGVEIACELGIDHYLNNVNRFKDNTEDLLTDSRHTNMCVMRFYTSLTSGKPVLQYKDPGKVFVSPFKKSNLSDIIHWYEEIEVTFGDFIRMVGASLTPEQLKKVFERNKSNHMIEDYEACSKIARNGAKIRLGYIEFESQDVEVYKDWCEDGNDRFQPTASDYFPNEEEAAKGHKRVERNYNVWYKAYYIPPSGDGKMGSADFDEQAEFIFDFGKVPDQQREGDNGIYSKCSLFGSVTKRKMTWWEIMNAYMPKINLLWQQYQNDMANAIPHGTVWVEEFLNLAMSVVDNKNDKGASLKSDIIKKIKQTGNAVAKMLNPETGDVIADGRPFVDVKTGHLNSAMERLNHMMELYQMMTRALGISETAEGITPKARTATGGIQMAMEGTNNATFFLEKTYINVLTEAGERLIYYFKQIVENGDSERLAEFEAVVGKANGMAMQSIKNIPMHTMGLSVQQNMSEEQKASVNQLANQMAGAGMLAPDIALFITMIDNVKYAYAILRLKMKERESQAQKAKQQEAEALAQAKNEERQFELMKQSQNNKETYQTKEMLKQFDMKMIELQNMLKHATMTDQKEQIKNNRVEEKIIDHQLDDKKTEKQAGNEQQNAA